MLRIALFIAFAIGFASPIYAQDIPKSDSLVPAVTATQPADTFQQRFAQAPPTLAPPTLPLDHAMSAPPATQNTITTTAPVSSNTTISVGTLAGQVLTWAATAFGSLLATVFAAWGVRMFKLAGVKMTDAMRDRLQEIILNGLNAAAKQETQTLAGKDQITIKNAVVAHAVAYTQDHGADTIKALGLDPQSGEAVEAIKARIETAIADPTIPTPTVLDPPAVPKAA